MKQEVKLQTLILVKFARFLFQKRLPVFHFQYVPEELLPIYQESIIPLADIITPNQFEAE